jgi:hypothetical protein
MVCPMTIRHVIVEGPDGSGKSGMVERLARDLPATVHPRASTSRGGPISDITSWHLIDLEQLEDGRPYGPWVYDRHPLISERRYAQNVRGCSPQGMYANSMWVTEQLKLLAQHAVMVWCLPPRSHVLGNVNRNSGEQMPGVVNGIINLYRVYARGTQDWPGYAVHWDYTVDHERYPVWLANLKNVMRNAEVNV